MSINVDIIYQRVLVLANKEQRGYITPLEFNLLANQAQSTIFEQYFYDLSQFERGLEDETPSISDMAELIKNKLDNFTTIVSVTGGTTYPANYRTGKIYANGYEAKLTTLNEVKRLLGSRFHRIGLVKNPVYVEGTRTNTDIEVYNGISASGMIVTGVTVEVITKPKTRTECGYDVVAEKALYNANRSIDFYLHESEEGLLVLKILELAGIVLNKTGLAQTAMSLEQAKVQQEKQ